MIPVFQTVRHNPPHSYGNCYRACIASILGCGIDDVPALEKLASFNNSDSDFSWRQVYQDWLKTTYRMTATRIILQDDPLVPYGYAILTGQSPRFKNVGHCAVTLDGKIVHDPAGEGAAPITEFWDFEVISAMEQIECFPVRKLHGIYGDNFTIGKQ